MKLKFRHFPIALALIVSCGSDDPETIPTPVPDPDPLPDTTVVADGFVRGADVSWYTEMAADGRRFYNADGEERTCPALMKELGMDAVRLRVWVHPQNKGCDYSDMADVVRKAAEADRHGLRVMIDFHYSDWWADPSRQEMPADWAGLSGQALLDTVYAHTYDVLYHLARAGVQPEWVQIGNETRNGMMHPQGQLWNNQGDIDGGWQRFVALYKAGYSAAKAVCPDAKVMPHLNHAYEDNQWWFDRFRAAGAAMDMIALSHYPQVDDASRTATDVNMLAVGRIRALSQRYGVPVMVSEIGVRASDPAAGATVLRDFMTRLASLNPNYLKEHPGTAGIDPSICAGIFYWEPQVYGGWKPSSYASYGWGAYDMGAFTDQGRPNAALRALMQ